MTTSSEIEVALRSSRTRNHGAVENEPHDGLRGERAAFHASQSLFTLLIAGAYLAGTNTRRSSPRADNPVSRRGGQGHGEPSFSASAASVRR